MQILTTIISIIAGGAITYFIARWQMKKHEIVHFSINSYDIGKGLSNEFPNFHLRYNGEDLTNDVKVLKGGFINNSNTDIANLKGKSDIKVILPEDCIVKTINVSPSISGLNINANIDSEKNNIIDFGINEVFKSDEYFKYTAIIEVTNGTKDLTNALKFEHRIINTKKINNVHIGQLQDARRRKFFKYVFVIYTLFLLICIPVALYQRVDFKTYKSNSNEEVKLYIGPQSQLYVDGNKFLPFVSGNKITAEELKNNYKSVPVTKFCWHSDESISAILFLILSIICIAMFYILTWGKNGHIINVISENEKNTRKTSNETILQRTQNNIIDII